MTHQNHSTASTVTRRCTILAGTIAAGVLAVAGCSSPPTGATPVTTEATTPVENVTPIVDEAALQAELDRLVDFGVPGAVLLVRDDDQTVVLTSGVSDLEAGTPMGADATFRIASLTKPYTASVVMQLVAEGTLSLDDTVEQWLPGIVSDADPITVRQLLGHTSGVADYFDDPAVLEPYLEGDYEYVWTPQQLIEIAEHLGATSAPGERVELLEHELRRSSA